MPASYIYISLYNPLFFLFISSFLIIFSFLFFSVLFYSVLFCSILFCSILISSRLVSSLFSFSFLFFSFLLSSFYFFSQSLLPLPFFLTLTILLIHLNSRPLIKSWCFRRPKGKSRSSLKIVSSPYIVNRSRSSTFNRKGLLIT